MVKFNRRYLLRAGLTVSALATTHAAQPSKANPVEAAGTPPHPIPQASEIPASGLANSASASPASANLAQLPDRTLASLLIQCCELAVSQHQRYLESATYQGSIQELGQYSPAFNRYTQIASFQAVRLPAQQQAQFHGVALKPREQLAIAGRREHLGFALTSTTHHVIALQASALPTPQFHSTAEQTPFPLAEFDTRQPYSGQINAQLQQIYQQLIPQIQAVAQQLNPALPCYITGYSLGGAIAPLVALQLAQSVPEFRPQLRVYTYGAPPVGDRTFVQFYNALLPHTHRIINLADLVPSVPASVPAATDDQSMGQEWAYFNQRGTLSLNHAIETYKSAVIA